ncbi:MAG: hypothetical protein WBC63_04945 [Candidatus Bipolaricaulia bacterium]
MRRLVLVASVVLAVGGVAMGQTISGSWNTDILIDPEAADIPTFLDFETGLTVTYEIAEWAFTSFTQLDDTGWIDQTFSAGGVLGAYSFGSTADFDPAGAFEIWEVTAGVTIGGMTFDSAFTLAEQDVTLILGGTGSTGQVEVDIQVTFGGDDNDVCDLIWGGLDITIEFGFCCAEVTATIEFDCDGFEYASFAVNDIAIPNLPWLSIDAEVRFQTESKTLTLSPDFDFDSDYCIDVYVAVENDGNLDFDDIYIDGIGLTCEFGTITFTGVSFWGEHATKPADLGDYWEMYKIESDEDMCCGPFSFEIAVFFDETSSNLADIALFTAEMEIEIGEPFTFSTGLEIDVTTGVTEWSIGFKITW